MRGATVRIDFSRLSIQFQSTRPVRGATRVVARASGHTAVSIHAPRAGRDIDRWLSRRCLPVSIHAPRAGRDQAGDYADGYGNVSIHAPRAGRDDVRKKCKDSKYVSIHAPRAGRD